jgi:hypothetical protein
VGVAGFWIVLCILATNVLGRQRTLFSSNLGSAAPQSVAPLTPADSTVPPADDGETPPADAPAPPAAESPAETAAPAEPASPQ